MSQIINLQNKSQIIKMSLSTLPDLFKNDKVKFLRSAKPQKIGGRFSLHLSQSISSPQKTQSSRNTNRQKSTNYPKTFITKQRSKSINNLLMTQTANQNKTFRKSTGFKESTILKKNSESFMSRQASTLQQIYYKNLMKTKISNDLNNMNFIENGFHPYQMSRTMNSRKIYMQEADSMKNKLENGIVAIQDATNQLQKIKHQSANLLEQLKMVKQYFNTDFQLFSSDFKVKCEDFSKNLSKLRRETNQETRKNGVQIRRINDQIHDAKMVLALLEKQSNAMRQQCLQDQQIQRTNSYTYQNVQIQRDLLNNLNSSEQLNFVNLNKAKRSGTSHQSRNHTPLMITGDRTARVQSNQQHRIQFSKVKKQVQATKNEQNEEDDEDLFKQMQYQLDDQNENMSEDSLQVMNARLNKKIILNGQQIDF